MDNISGQIDAQEKITKLVQKRHEQISEIKLYFDCNNKNFFKGIVKFGQNLNKFEQIFTKKECQLKCENIISLTLSIGKIMDLNNSIKTILLSIKIFEEHKKYIEYIDKPNYSNNNKNDFITNIFHKKNSIPLSQNNFIKERIEGNIKNEDPSYKIFSKFFNSLFGNDSNFFTDLNNYCIFQSSTNLNNKKKYDKKEENNKLNKINSLSFSDINIFYNRVNLNFELDYPSTVYSSCDLFYILYNKMMDNICYNPNFLSYIEELDEYIVNYFIKPSLNDLVKLSELIVKNEVEELNYNLEKIYK